MALRQLNLSALKPIDVPDALDQYKTVLGLRGAQLQQADIAEQINERHATAQKTQLANQQAQQAAQIVHDHMANGGKFDDSLVEALFSAGLPAHAEQIQKSLNDISARKSSAETAAAGTKNADTTAARLQEDMNKRKADETRKNAEEAAGIIIPSTEFDIKDSQGKTQRAARYRVRMPDGSYTEETRMFGEMAPPPQTPIPGRDVPLSPAVQAQKVAIAQASKALPEAPELGDIVETTKNGRQYIPTNNLTQKQKEAVNVAASKAGIPVVDKDTAEMLRDLDTARANQAFMLKAIENKLPKDAAGRAIVGPANKLKQIGQLDPDLAATGTFRNAAIQSMRALAGSRGLRINQAEINMAQENDIPKPTDTVEVARKELQNILTLLDNTEKAHLQRDRSGASSSPAGGLDEALDKAFGPRK